MDGKFAAYTKCTLHRTAMVPSQKELHHFGAKIAPRLAGKSITICFYL